MIKRSFIVKTFFIAVLFISSNHAISQAAGDEDPEMFNRGQQRDQQAIDDALNGWWKKSMETHEQRIQWWRQAKFGMFIHWGVYSLPGGEWKGKKVSGYAEHLMRKEKITRADYLELAHRFNPVQFNAEEWILNAKNAGMNYFIITSKHHDGFAMYDSKVSDFNIIQQTPFKRDPMAELAAAAKKHGVKFGFYYSHAFDWEHPEAPGNDWEYNNPGGDLQLHGGRNWYDKHPDLLIKAQRYVDEKAIPQIKELINKYHPDILWFDTPSKLPLSENIRIMKATRAADPNVVINGRLARSSAVSFGDYINTADRPAEFFPVTGDWEAIPTTNESYGYHQYDNSHKPVSHFIQLMANAASRGGNLLMNIGPKGDGKMDMKDVNILKGIGQWIDKNRESVFGAGISPLPLQSWGVSTLRDNKLYLHVFNWPADGKLYVGGLKNAITKAYLLTQPQKTLAVTRINENDLFITVPRKAPDTSNTVIIIGMKGKPEVNPVRYVAANIPETRLLAFDAELQGGRFRFGDGKTNRYYVDNWTSKEQAVNWTIRLTKPARFKVVIRYLTGEDCGGEYIVKINGKEYKETVESGKNNQVITKTIAEVQLKEGKQVITIQPVTISKKELMKLFEVQLIKEESGK